MRKVRNIILVGATGSGKSSVGPILASLQGLGFVDLDSIVEKKKKNL